jgi:hypothetical protein
VSVGDGQERAGELPFVVPDQPCRMILAQQVALDGAGPIRAQGGLGRGDRLGAVARVAAAQRRGDDAVVREVVVDEPRARDALERGEVIGGRETVGLAGRPPARPRPPAGSG